MLSLGLSLTSVFLGRASAGFSPASLFADGQQGFWSGGYDPEQGRLFQDAAGTTPATLPRQPVGLAQRMAGTVDASQTVALSRPTLARWPKGGRRNLLTWTEEFDNAGWEKSGTATVVGNLFRCGAIAASEVRQSNLFLASGNATFSLDAAAENSNFVVIHVFDVATSSFRRTWFNLATGAVGSSAGSGANISFVSAGIENIGGGKYRCRLSVNTVAATTPARATIFLSNADAVFNGDASSGVFIYGAQLEVGSVATPYQKVTTANDITEAGVPDVWHLSNDGGDSLSAILPEGTYGRAWVDADGLVTVDTAVDPVDAIVGDQQVDIILRQGAFTSEEEAKIRTYWARYAA